MVTRFKEEGLGEAFVEDILDVPTGVFYVLAAYAEAYCIQGLYRSFSNWAPHQKWPLGNPKP